MNRVKTVHRWRLHVVVPETEVNKFAKEPKPKVDENSLVRTRVDVARRENKLISRNILTASSLSAP